MKQRKGFISNSSSTCFICQVCGEDVSGRDMCMSDADMDECENGHVLCNGHKLDIEIEQPTAEQKRAIMLADLTEQRDWWAEQPEKYALYVTQYQQEIAELEPLVGDDLWDYFEVGYGAEWWDDYESEKRFSEQRCPICQFKKLTPEDALRFLRGYLGWTQEKTLGVMKQFGDYKSFRKAMK